MEGTIEFYQLLFYCTSGAVFASMLAYIAAQFCDVQLFHFWKRVTKGKHLWVRNNFSTLISQLVDSFMVIAVTFGAAFLAGDMALATLFTLMVSNYFFKMAVALADTPAFLRPYAPAPTPPRTPRPHGGVRLSFLSIVSQLFRRRGPCYGCETFLPF